MRLNSTARLAFYNARQRQGDVTRLSEVTGYSTSHISNVINGRRSINPIIANELYKISSLRLKTSDLAY
jgi:plasmid maintenance system antidote protein VapI